MTAATALALALDHSTREALQRHAHYHLSSNVAQFPHSVTPPSHGQHAMEQALKSYNQNSKTFRERVRDALKARLHPNTNLHAKQLAYCLQISEATIWNLLSANNEPSGRVIDKLVEFFRDPFINEIWGCHNIICIDRADARRADAVRRLEEARAELEAMES